jgi:hypothetical protein
MISAAAVGCSISSQNSVTQMMLVLNGVMDASVETKIQSVGRAE